MRYYSIIQHSMSDSYCITSFQLLYPCRFETDPKFIPILFERLPYRVLRSLFSPRFKFKGASGDRGPYEPVIPGNRIPILNTAAQREYGTLPPGPGPTQYGRGADSRYSPIAVAGVGSSSGGLESFFNSLRGHWMFVYCRC